MQENHKLFINSNHETWSFDHHCGTVLLPCLPSQGICLSDGLQSGDSQEPVCPVHLYFATSRITCASACTLKEGGSPRMAIHFEEYQCECGQAFCLNLSEVDTPIKVFVHDICDKLDGN